MSSRVPRPLVLLLVFSCWLALAAVGCGSSGGPREGYWGGPRLTFEVVGGEVADLRPLAISCNGEGGCYADFFHVDPEFSTAIVGNTFEVTLTTAQGTMKITGLFESSTFANGSFEFTSANGCCSQQGKWAADFLAPFEQPADLGAAEWTGDDDLREQEDQSGGQFYPPGATPEQIQAINYVNQIRAALDLPPLTEIESINKASQAHADYFELHCDQYLSTSLSPHSQNPAWPEGFVGTDFYDRMSYFGFSGYPGWEVMAFMGNPVAAIDGWMETLYHRIPFVHPAALETGYGMVKGGCFQWSSGTDVMDFSRSTTTSVTEPVAYPWDGQTGVNPSWNGAESPQPPLPKGQGYPSGPIITFTFPQAGNFTITSHELLAPDGLPVPHMYVDAATDPAKFLSETVSLYAYDPLAEFTIYTVRLKGTFKKEPREWQWSFTTGKTPAGW